MEMRKTSGDCQNVVITSGPVEEGFTSSEGHFLYNDLRSFEQPPNEAGFSNCGPTTSLKILYEVLYGGASCAAPHRTEAKGPVSARIAAPH